MPDETEALNVGDRIEWAGAGKEGFVVASAWAMDSAEGGTTNYLQVVTVQWDDGFETTASAGPSLRVIPFTGSTVERFLNGR